MIITTLGGLEPYKAIGRNLSMALDYLLNTDLPSLPGGRTNIDGDNLYAVVSSYPTRPHNVSRYETHDLYVDIQLMLQGEEIIHWQKRSLLTPDGPNENDKQRYRDNPGAGMLLLGGDVVGIYFPEDAHKACCKTGEEICTVKKLLLKVRL